MFLRFFCILAAVTQIISQKESDDVDCTELFKTFIHPKECCNYPSRHITMKVQEKCKESCERISDHTKGCCLIDCSYHETGVLVSKKFDEKALLELYENYLEEKGAGKFDQWMPIVEKSIEECVKLVRPSDEIFACNVPLYVLDTMDCVATANFRNCPNFAETLECHELKHFARDLETCGKTINGSFIIDYRFFDFDDDNEE